MSGMLLNFGFSDGAYLGQVDPEDEPVTGEVFRFWLGEGQPDFMGNLTEFGDKFPGHMAELVASGAVRRKRTA